MKSRLVLAMSFLLSLILLAGMALQQGPSTTAAETPPAATEFQTAFFIYDAQDDVFYTQGPDALIAVNAAGVTLYRAGETLHLEFVGADPQTQPTGAARQPGVVNLYTGNDPTRWREQLPLFAEVVYQELYPGIALHYTLENGGLKSEFVVQPGADPTQIALRYEDAAGLSLDAAGNLRVASRLGTATPLTEQAPHVYQQVNGREIPLRAAFEVRDKTTYGFTLLDTPDPTLPLVIDPLLQYSSYLGGPSKDEGWAVALDSEHNIMVTGVSWSYSFPPENIPGERPQKKVFVAKLAPTGDLIYVTFFGGQISEEGNAIRTDAAGNTYVSGETYSSDFPVLNAWQPVFGGDEDAYLLKLTPAGTLVYSTFLGGSESEEVDDMYVAADGKIYLAGEVYSEDFPLLNPWQSQTFGLDDEDAFISIFDPQGTLIYSTYVGSYRRDQIFRLTVDEAGIIYAGGMTSSDSGLRLVNPIQSVYGGEWDDGFVLKLNPWTNQMLFSTYLGGAGRDEIWGIDLDSAGNIYIAGGTNSSNFPLRAPLQSSYGGGEWDAFVAKIDGATYQLLYSTYLGGAAYDFAWGLELDSGDNVYIVGETESPNFPVRNPLQGTLHGKRDAFLAQLNPAGTLQYASFLGGSDVERGFRLTVREDWVVTVVGATRSPDFPLQNAKQPYLNNPPDGFVAQFGIVPTPSPTPSPTPTSTPAPASTAIGPEGGTLTQQYPGHRTQLLIPAGVLNTTTTFTLSYRRFPTSQGDLEGIDHFFELQAVPTPMPFSSPLQLRLSYSPTVIISGTMGLYRLEAGKWVTEGITMTGQSIGQLQADIRYTGVYGLLGETNRLYLPLVLRRR